MGDWIILLKLILAAILGAALGYEREIGKKAAGLRTHMLVCMGSALIMLVSIYVGEKGGAQADPGRIAAGVITGIGFLGAGTILRRDKGVSGLTTAASLWTTASIGLAVGCGFFWPAIVTVIITLLVLRFVGTLSKHLNLL